MQNWLLSVFISSLGSRSNMKSGSAGQEKADVIDPLDRREEGEMENEEKK